MSIPVWRALPVLLILIAACTVLPASASPYWQNASEYLTAASTDSAGNAGVQQTALVTKWHVETVDRSLGYGVSPSLAFDAGDIPHIAYDNYTMAMPFSEGSIKYASRGSTGWKKIRLGPGSVPSLQLDGNGNPRVSFFRSGGASPAGMEESAENGQYAGLFYGWKDSGGFHSEYVTQASGISFPFRSSLDLTGTGKPRIAFTGPWESVFPVLKYAWKDPAWDIDRFGDPAYQQVGDCSLSLDNAGRPGIAYTYIAGGSGAPASGAGDGVAAGPLDAGVKYAWVDGSGRHEDTAVSGIMIGQYLSLARDANGRPRIVYYDGTSGYVMYAWKDGSGWRTKRVAPATYVTCSIAVDGKGSPHIAYIDMKSGLVRYATLKNGAWESETIDRNAMSFISLALNSRGTPAVSYMTYNGENFVLKFATPAGSYMGRIL